jgi:hypothetical protein
MRFVLSLVAATLLFAACSNGDPLFTYDQAPEATAGPSLVSDLPTPEPTDAPTSTPAATVEATPATTSEPTPTATPTPSPTPTSTPTPTPTPAPTPRPTAAPTSTPAPAPTEVPPPASTPATASYTSSRAALAGAAPRLGTLPVPASSYLDDAMIVSLYGFPGVCTMGELGCHSTDRTIGAVQRLADRYDALNGSQNVIPALHLIVDVAQPTPRSDGSYLGRMSLERVAGFVELARQHGLLLFLDLQIGWTEPVASVRRYEQFLDEPFVHIALDPEFATRSKNAAPGEVVGEMTAGQVNEVQRYLAGIVREHDIPQKLLIVHQFRTSMLINPENFASVPEVTLSVDMDGVGKNFVKLDGYWRYANASYSETPSFKLFLQRDLPQVLRPEQVLDLDVPPAYVIYQ